MTIIQFKNRTRELSVLKEFLESKKFGFLVLYGRRRIGKTALALHATDTSRRVYYLATGKEDINAFANEAAKVVPSISALKPEWEILFGSLKEEVDVVIIDEFQNLILSDPKVLGIFQRTIDNILSGTSMKLIVCGSSISTIRALVLDYASPLYGRRTSSMNLGPVGFFDLPLFFPDANFEQLMELYGFTGGIPYYITKVDKSFWTWLEGELENRASFLNDELQFLLRYEFNETSTYETILNAIASGETKIGEIKNRIGLVRTDISPYLKNLINVGFVNRVIPFGSNQKSREGRYYLSDNFLRFWYRYIFPNISSITSGIFDITIIKNDYRSYLGKIFEDVAKQYLIKNNGTPIQFTSIGPWWHKDVEIGLVARNDITNDIMFIECKYSFNVNGNKVVRLLREKAKKYDPTKIRGRELFVIFALSFEDKPVDKEVLYYDLNTLQ